MDKVARKPSSDPIQEQLREHKASWNKDVSSFINDLINFKKMMNGAPSKFHMEKMTIKEPIPSDPATIIGSLAGDFQELAQKGNKLIEEQINYSKNRKKTMPKAPGGMAPAPSGTPDLSQQLAAASLEFMLMAEGSNPVSRFVSTMNTPWFGSDDKARNRKYRLSLLRVCVDLDKQFKKFGNEIVGSTPESIFSAGKMLNKIEDHFNYIFSTVSALNIKTSDKPAAPKQQSSVELSLINEAKECIKDFDLLSEENKNLDPILVSKFLEAMNAFINAPNVDILPQGNKSPQLQAQLAAPVIKTYHNILELIKKQSEEAAKQTVNPAPVPVQAPTVVEDAKPELEASAQMELIAQGSITTWLGKIKHKLSPFDKTSALRLDLLRISKESRKLVDTMMNSLEKDIDMELLTASLKQLAKNIMAMHHLMNPLESTVKDKMFDKTFIDLLKKKKITEYDFALDPAQKQKLEKMLQTKQMKDLTHFYSRR